MQDKYQQRKYASQGWKGMKVILDREMPLDGRRDRVPVFLWLTGVAVVLLVAGGLYFSSLQDATPALQKPVEISEPMAVANEGRDKDVTELQITGKEKQEIDETTKVLSPGSPLTPAAKGPGSHPDGASGNLKPNQSVQQDKEFGDILDSAPQNVKSIPGQVRQIVESRMPYIQEPDHRQPAAKAKRIETESVILPQHSDLARNANVLLPLTRKVFPVASPYVTVLPERFLSPIRPEIRPLGSKPRGFHLAFGVMGTVNAAAGGMQGLGGGPEARWRISRKVSLCTGVLYESQRKNGFLNFADREDASLTSSPVTIINGPSGNVVNAVSMDVDAGSVESLTSSFHFLHIPAGVEYFLGRSFSLEFGARYSRLLGAPSEEKIALVDGDQLQQDVNQLSGVSRNSLFAHDFVRKNDVSMRLGANIYLWRRLALHLEYNHGLLPIFRGGDNSVSDSRNRMFTLGARYHLSRV